MKNRKTFILGLILILFGILNFAHAVGIFECDLREFLGYAFLLYGLFSTYLSFGKDTARGRLFLSVCVFLLGVLFIVITNFDIPSYQGVFLTTVLFIPGAGLLILYLQNYKETFLLITSVILILLSAISLYFYSSLSIIQFADKIAGKIISNWEIVFILFGFILLESNRREI
ncbi:MAG: hypothetical protein V1720_20640 [bacterium]